jgi:SAM-dependent methyltransferase
MPADFREEVAKFYDCDPRQSGDIEFYRKLIPSAKAAILELGCGTGRVLIPLASHCDYILGVDISEPMLKICREKLQASGISRNRAGTKSGDITALILERRFDLIIAPFRVFQNLKTDEEVAGLFETVGAHLSDAGSCILNVFKPFLSREAMATQGVREEENLSWETPTEDGRIALYDRLPRIDSERQIIYPELVYRRYRGDVLEDEVIHNIALRYYYPDQLEELITAHGFKIVNRWGGYADEPYGEGPELVIQFCKR